MAALAASDPLVTAANFPEAALAPAFPYAHRSPVANADFPKSPYVIPSTTSVIWLTIGLILDPLPNPYAAFALKALIDPKFYTLQTPLALFLTTLVTAPIRFFA